ncbi:MAG: hypothetical protein GF364_11200 [Candidatus Lokiarchaeota archaeon]|nr:hypothetical protein [Candidatus Lokiarchaeota archaeon]
MKKSTKKILSCLVVLAAVSLATGVILLYNNNSNGNNDHSDYSWASDPNRLNMPEERSNLTLIIDFNNGTVLEFKDVDLDDHYTTEFDLVNSCCIIEYDIYWWTPVSFFISSINGLKGDWTFEVEGEYIPTGANTISPENNSISEWIVY